MTAYVLAFGSLLLVGGRVADLIGRRAAILIGLTGFGLASALGQGAVDPAHAGRCPSPSGAVRCVAGARDPGGHLHHLHLELSTRQGYRSNLDPHFLPYFGRWQMARILPSVVQGWVTAADGLAPTSIRKYHTMLHSIFERAERDQLILTNPCAHTELPKRSSSGAAGP